MGKTKPKIAEAVSIIAHQLKTPISVIKGYLEALISGDCGEINPSQKDYLSDALENVKKMSSFVENILDISRIETQEFKLKLIPVTLDKITEEVLKNLSTWIKASNSEVAFKKPDTLPKVLTDETRIRQVIQNLITNAIKYKKEGKGRITITIEQRNKKVIFSCQDNGISIPKKDFKKIFSKFYRSEEAIKKDPSGSGLGLYINKATIELSKGKIWFSKNRNSGMTFYFSLPTAK